MLRIGIDVGSTTVKLVAVSEAGEVVFTDYRRHNARARAVLADMLRCLCSSQGDGAVSVRLTGSVALGLSEQEGLPFVQEVVAAASAIRHRYPDAQSMIDIGGEDAKVVFFRQGEATDLRMNGNCAGGTGAFIDQMAVLLGVDVNELNALALKAKQVYPIASRCGVFCKTDVQNLIAKNVCREDIAASIFHAVAVQTVVTLAHGCDITAPVLFCGGPLTFIPALRKAFLDYLSLGEDGVIIPENGTLLTALGAALYAEQSKQEEATCQLSALIASFGCQSCGAVERTTALPPLFSSEAERAQWQERMVGAEVVGSGLRKGPQDAFLGIDSGSTTTKIVLTDPEGRILHSFYHGNVGSPIETVTKGLQALQDACEAAGTQLRILGSCSTGYGEDLIKAAFQLDHGIVETMAHYLAATRLEPAVSFILDIGGQDMKAIFVNHGVIDRIEINEACSSGCGSFIETFARTLGHTVGEFASEACQAAYPCDLGTRCTVFMNSKVKQALREGATMADIAAGLAYSVVKNCLHKVLKLKDLSVLGDHIVVQGGTMRNDAVVRALELLTGKQVARPSYPELMGALGCALYAQRHVVSEPRALADILSQTNYTSRLLHCSGCDNQCLVVRYTFAGGQRYFSGNRCERVFTNGGRGLVRGANVYRLKNDLLFNRPSLEVPSTIGIPRVLNLFEDYPFWHTLFTASGFRVVLSAPSRFANYEHSARLVMSDNICFPAKLVHSHIQNLLDQHVDRIFMPFVVYEHPEQCANSYNCPVVSGYSEVVKSVQAGAVPIDSPSITFKDPDLLRRQCADYLRPLGVSAKTFAAAFKQAQEAQAAFAEELVRLNEETLSQARCGSGQLTILLAGRPYHADPLIQHKVADMLSDMGIHVITDDIVRDKDIPIEQEAHFLAQWAYPNRILKAARWCAEQDANVQFVQLTSFGCGPDAFLLDEVRDLLLRHGKVPTLLKLDDINNVGSMKLRVRSLVESLKLSNEPAEERVSKPLPQPPIFTEERRRDCKILAPFFTPFISPLIPAIMSLDGYDVECLPMSDAESADCGLAYANNEVCYPATLIVGDMVKALRSGRYDPAHTAVVMTQTGGQCRASNYLALIKRAFAGAGFTQVPVIAFAVGGDIKNNQPGFHPHWRKLLPVALRAILFSDAIAKFYYAAIVREHTKGQALSLRDTYLSRAAELIRQGRSQRLLPLLAQAAVDFDRACLDKDCPRVGVVGEIFLKFNPYAQQNVTAWLVDQGVEVAPPILIDFFLQSFVNRKANERARLKHKSKLGFLADGGYLLIRRYMQKVNRTAAAFRYFTPFHDIFDEARQAEQVVPLTAQFGEGWLLPAEIMTYARSGVQNVISLQPFGCIANHIVSKGIERSVKRCYPDLNLLSLDFDSGVSEVNVTNRMLLFVDKLKRG